MMYLRDGRFAVRRLCDTLCATGLTDCNGLRAVVVREAVGWNKKYVIAGSCFCSRGNAFLKVRCTSKCGDKDPNFRQVCGYFPCVPS